MKIAIDISPLTSGHKVRGTGFYLSHLKHALLTHFHENEYFFFTSPQTPPHNVDIVHYPYFEPFIRTLPIIKKHKTVVTVLDLIPIIFPKHFPSGIKGNLIWQAQRYLLSRMDAVITDSQSSKKDIVNIIHYPGERIKVAYLAPGDEFKPIVLSAKEKESVRRRYNLPDKFILYVGDVTWNKNVPRLIEAVQQVKIHLVLVGKAISTTKFDRENAWNRDLVRVQSLIQRDKNITTVGFVPTEDLLALYNMACVFVFPSVYEGFGLPIVEAMACGTPVITTKESSLSEIGKDAVYYVNGYQTAEIAQGIREVYNNANLQKDLKEKGLLRVKEFTWKKTAAETVDTYKSIL